MYPGKRKTRQNRRKLTTLRSEIFKVEVEIFKLQIEIFRSHRRKLTKRLSEKKARWLTKINEAIHKVIQ